MRELVRRPLHRTRDGARLDAASPGHAAIEPAKGTPLDIWGVRHPVIDSPVD